MLIESLYMPLAYPVPAHMLFMASSDYVCYLLTRDMCIS